MIGYQRTRFFAILFLLLIFEKGKIRLVSVSTSIADTLTSLNKLSSSLNKPSSSLNKPSASLSMRLTQTGNKITA